jgi:hypothetical protein
MANSKIRVTYTEDHPFVNNDCPKMPSLHVTKGCPRPGKCVFVVQGGKKRLQKNFLWGTKGKLRNVTKILWGE